MKKHKPKRMFGKDTITYSLTRENNPTYERDLEDWNDGVDDYDPYTEPKPKYLRFKIIINGVEIKQFSDPYELCRVNKGEDCYGHHWWYPNDSWDEIIYPDNERKYSNFYPFTCSCGHAGCDGIFDGVHLKVRGRSVEWRVNKNMGYIFLDKTFYQFDKQDYFDMLEKLKEEVECD